MYLKLEKGGWDTASLALQTDEKDYDLLERDGLLVFVYGYPYVDSAAKWFSAQDALEAYLSGGLDFVDNIDGVYSVLIVDRRRRKCFLITDRYGIYTLFYAKTSEGVAFSDTVGALASEERLTDLDHDSIIEYFVIGYKLGNKTHVKGVYECEAATVYEIDEDLQLRVRRYWQFTGLTEDDRVSRAEITRMFNDHLATAMELEATPLLPLTGGIDTRTLLSACLPAKERLRCYTHGVPGARDVRMARKMCRRFGIPHECYQLDKDWALGIPHLLDQRAGLMNGLNPVLNWIHLEHSFARAARRGDMLISGIMGNELWRAQFCQFNWSVATATTRQETAAAIAAGFTKTRHLFDVYRGRDVDDVVRLVYTSVSKEISAAGRSEGPVGRSELFAFRGYCNNWASNALKHVGKWFKVFPGMLHRHILPQLPLRSLEEKLVGGLQKHIICSNSPYLAGLPLDSGDTVKTTFRSRMLGAFYRLPWQINRLSWKLLGRRAFHEAFTSYPKWMRENHGTFVRKICAYEEMATKDLFEESTVEWLVESFLANKNWVDPFMISLLSLETWFRSFAFGRGDGA